MKHWILPCHTYLMYSINETSCLFINSVMSSYNLLHLKSFSYSTANPPRPLTSEKSTLLLSFVMFFLIYFYLPTVPNATHSYAKSFTVQYYMKCFLFSILLKFSRIFFMIHIFLNSYLVRDSC